MNIQIALLIALSYLGLGAGQVSVAQMLKLKHRVKTASDSLQFYNTNSQYAASELRALLKKMTIDETAHINEAVNQVHELIKEDIAAAQKEGKNVDQCYESVEDQLNAASRKAFTNFHECLAEIFKVLDNLEHDIESHKLKKTSLLDQIDITYSCIDNPRGPPMQVCNAQELSWVSRSVNAYEEAGQKLKNTGHQLTVSSKRWLLGCLQKQLDNLKDNVDIIRKSAVECIEAA